MGGSRGGKRQYIVDGRPQFAGLDEGRNLFQAVG